MNAPTPDLTFETYQHVAMALGAVLVLIGLAGWILRQLIARGVVAGNLLPMGTGSNRRLAILEVRTLDLRHRLVLVRRDDVEHLLLLGPTTDLVIETGITAGRLPLDPSPGNPAP